MDLTLTAEQQQLASAVRELLTDRADPQRVRAAMAGDPGYDRELWRRLGTELGVLGLVVPEEYGGSGAGHVERAVVAEELGRALAPAPFLASAVLTVDTLLALPDESARKALLPGLASGERIGALAVAEPGTGPFDEQARTTRAVPDGDGGDGWVLHGRKSPVLGGESAEDLLVYAGTAEGPAFFHVAGEAPGLTRTALAGLDPTRRLARVECAGTPARRLAGDGAAALSAVGDRALVALAAEQVGVLSRSLEMTVEYGKTRVQFGRAIGSYQSVKHGLADAYATSEQAYSALRYATWAADHEPAELPLAAALAASYVGPGCFEVAFRALHYHGGIGYTWEHDAQLYYKRAKSDELLLGAPARHRERLADLLEV
jgi:alkylation response protein AidB-like acyl-CoA dehydrogenase